MPPVCIVLIPALITALDDERLTITDDRRVVEPSGQVGIELILAARLASQSGTAYYPAYKGA